jgi:hypothetical protein
MRPRIAGLAALVLALSAAPAAAQRPDSALLGSWEGQARITVDWTRQRELMVRVSISPDGSVAGTIGDAGLTGGRVFDNRGTLSRALRVGPQWVIEGRLAGPLIRAENLQRESLRISVALKAGTLEGALETSGTEDGGKESMKLTASGLVLRRAGPIVSVIR